MLVKVLGTAAGGGFPQWNCNCSCCQTSRLEPEKAPARLHACIAISSTGKNWYLVNATPDIRFQMESCRNGSKSSSLRFSPCRGILLTDAEFDHTIGLLIVREGSELEIYASTPVIDCLTDKFPVRTMLSSYANFDWRTIEAGREFLIDNNEIEVTPFHLGDKPPKYALGDGASTQVQGQVLGYQFKEVKTGNSIVYAPQVGSMDGKLTEFATVANMLFIDGTCSYNEEIPKLGISPRTSLDMGHLPLFESDGIVNGVKRINQQRKKNKQNDLQTFLLHINNTNPICVLNSKESEKLKDTNIKVAIEGDELRL